jgi:hypothetical protein
VQLQLRNGAPIEILTFHPNFQRPKMGTQFEDFTVAGIENFFDSDPSNGNSQVECFDEDKLIKDGNTHILERFESQRKREDYSRSQTSRYQKELSLNMSTVDWSGFPGAAHRKSSPLGDKNRRRSSHFPKEGEGELLASTAKLERRRSVKEQPRSMSPRHSPAGRHRCRRQILAAGTMHLPTSENETVGGEKKSRTPLESSRRRAETTGRSTGSHRAVRRNSSKSLGRSKSQSRSLTLRPKTEAQRRSLSPSVSLRLRHQSNSPSGRLRRTVAAAASSTTLEVSGDLPRSGAIPSRGASKGRRKTKERKATAEEDAARFHHVTSLKW